MHTDKFEFIWFHLFLKNGGSIVCSRKGSSLYWKEREPYEIENFSSLQLPLNGVRATSVVTAYACVLFYICLRVSYCHPIILKTFRVHMTLCCKFLSSYDSISFQKNGAPSFRENWNHMTSEINGTALYIQKITLIPSVRTVHVTLRLWRPYSISVLVSFVAWQLGDAVLILYKPYVSMTLVIDW